MPILIAGISLVVDALATAGPGGGGAALPIGPGLGPSSLASVQYPSGSSYWFGTYDFDGDWETDIWKFDHPVSLIFLSWDPFSAENVRSIIRGLGFNASGGASAGSGGLSVGYSQDPTPDTFGVWCGFPVGEKMAPDPLDADSFYHVRVYAYNDTWWKRTGHPYMAVATCHLDVNELTSATLGWDTVPSGFPTPDLGLPSVTLYRFGGNSEYVEDHVADAWAERYPTSIYPTATVERDAAYLGNVEDSFEIYSKFVSGPPKRHRARAYGVTGKWWNCDGWATILWMP